MPTQRVYLAVDAANLLYSTSKQTHINYEALLDLARQRGQIVESAIYIPRSASAERERTILLNLKYAGFTRVISRPLRRRPDNSNKSDIDVALTMDVWEAALRRRMDVVMLASGDSDFIPLIEQLNNRAIEVDVIGPNQCTAWELIVASKHFWHTSDVEGLVSEAALPRHIALQTTLHSA